MNDRLEIASRVLAANIAANSNDDFLHTFDCQIEVCLELADKLIKQESKSRRCETCNKRETIVKGEG